MNARKKKTMLLLGALAPVGLWRASSMLSYLPSSTPAPVAGMSMEVPVEGEMPAEAAMMPGDPSAWFIGITTEALARQEQRSEMAWARRDPFGGGLPPAPPKETVKSTAAPSEKGKKVQPEPPRLKFTGVSAVRGKWLAIVDDQIVRVGDVVAGRCKVINITRHALVLDEGPWTYRFEIGSDKAVVEHKAEGP